MLAVIKSMVTPHKILFSLFKKNETVANIKTPGPKGNMKRSILLE